MKSDLVDIEVWLHHETSVGEENEGAYLVSLDHKDKQWVPKRACEFELTNPRSGRGILTLPEKLAVEKGLV